MQGLYLYCLREKTENSPGISIKGIDGEEEVFTIPYKELEAVVSNVSLEEFGSEEIQKKSQEDLKWIKEKALAHERVIEEAMKNKDKVSSVIPMRFGTIFKEKTSLEETLYKGYAKAKENLDKIRGKQEWSVKIYLKDMWKLEQTVKEKNETIKEKEKEMASLPEGMAFFMEEELRKLIGEETDKEVNNIADEVFKALGKQSGACVKSKILGKELTGKSEPMVSNAAYLVSEEKIGGFKKEIENLNQKMPAKGVYLECGGPWPAYNFVSF
ncbi:MAG: GvpL/GvpF family gas vesicle protein [Elusimicrobia bacterium]|nr:GvpL/GvpF family gas vesicle protein [Elusimicrobiota bacterium]